MKLSVSILCFNQVETTKRCVEHLLKTAIEDVEFILTDNGSSDGTFDFLSSCDLPNKKLLRHGVNIGFGAGHNTALEHTQGELFLPLNNDMFIKEHGWQHMVQQAFADPKVALAGLLGTPCALKSDGHGHVASQREYVEGSFLVARTALVKQYGLFSPAMHMFLFDDSDLSLRFRQMGWDVVHIPLDYEHRSHVTLRRVDTRIKRQIVEHNQKVFLARWSTYLKKRRFVNRILVRIPSVGCGDAICATPAIAGLRRDHPTAEMIVESNFPDIFDHNPNITISRRLTVTPNGSEYDRCITLDPDYAATVHLIQLYAEQAATTVREGRQQIFLTDGEIDEADRILAPLRRQYKRIVLCALQMSRNGWQGRNWTERHAHKFVRILAQQGNVGVVEVGAGFQSSGAAHVDLVGKTSLRQLFAVVSLVDVCVTIDSLVLHVAQAFRRPTYALFGATEPVSRIADFTTCFPVRRNDLDCLGCYHRKGDKGFNRCLRGDEACLTGMTPEIPLQHIQTDDHLYQNINYLQSFVRRRMSH